MLLMGKSAMSMAIFHCFLYVHQRVTTFDPPNPQLFSASGAEGKSQGAADGFGRHLRIGTWDGVIAASETRDEQNSSGRGNCQKKTWETAKKTIKNHKKWRI